MHMNRLSFTLKWWAESLVFKSVVYAQPLPEAISTQRVIILYGLWAACRWWSVRSCCDKQEVRCRVCLNLSRLRYGCQRCTLAVVAQHCYLLSARGRSIFRKYLNAHLKFTVYGHKQAHTYVNTLPQTHFRNAVPLVWGSFRLAPIMLDQGLSSTRVWCNLIWSTMVTGFDFFFRLSFMPGSSQSQQKGHLIPPPI